MNVASALDAAPCRAPELTPLSDWTSCIVELWSSTVSSIIDCIGAAEQMNIHKTFESFTFSFMMLENIFEHPKLWQALIMRSKKNNFFFLTLKLLQWIAREDTIVTPDSLFTLIGIS